MIYQQQLCYIQKRGLTCSPVELFDKDLVQQIKEWRDKGEWIVLLMDVNDHPLNSKFTNGYNKSVRTWKSSPTNVGDPLRHTLTYQD
jgi:hypothetical protein